MDGKATTQHPSSLGDTPNPTLDMLPAFRVRDIRPSGQHGIVRMKRHEYDELLKRQPRAALRYIDESDGEVILVGSSLELDQRLTEPIEAHHQTKSKNLELSGLANSQSHIFEIEKDFSVLSEWRSLDQRTSIEGQKAKEVFFGRAGHPPQPPAKDKDTGKAPRVRFGETTLARGSVKPVPPISEADAHASRWASYRSLPGSLDKEPVAVVITPPRQQLPMTTPSKIKSKSTTDLKLAVRSLSDLDESAVSTLPTSHPLPVRSSTLQIPATPKQQNEHQPLVDMFYPEPEKQPAAPSNVDTPQQKPKEWQPLMELFETQLAELTNPSADPSSEEKQKDDAPSASKGPFAQKSGELLSQSIQSLLNGVGLLAATFKKTNTELQQQLALAQQDFPNNIDKALKASVAAIDALRSMIPATKPEEHTVASPAAATAAAASTDGAVEQTQVTDAQKARMLSNRYKLQRHLLQPRKTQTDADLLQVSDLLEELELQTVMGSITADLLTHSKIHKVLKRVSKSDKVPGDDKYMFRRKSWDISHAWMAILEKHRKEVQNSKKKAATTSPSGDSMYSASQEQAAFSVVQENKSPSKINAASDGSPLNQGDRQVEAWASGQDEQHADRVEQATEQMRRELLEMGLLPPPERSVAAYYTRADVLEAYVRKFHELRQLVHHQNTPKPTVSNAATSTQVDLKPDGKMGGIIKDDNPLDLLDLSYEDKTERALQEHPNEPRVTRDHVSSVQELDVKPKFPTPPAGQFSKVQQTSQPNSAAPRSTLNANVQPEAAANPQLPRSEPNRKWLEQDILTRASSVPKWAPYSHRPTQEWPPLPPKKEPQQLRHRQSWHPGSTTSNSHGGTGPYPFESPGFSPVAAMERYPPVSQILWRKPPVAASTADHPAPKSGPVPVEPRKMYDTSPSVATRALTRLDAQFEKPSPKKQSDKRVQFQDSEAKRNMQKCINQLVEMGFVRGKAEAVAQATMGNLEMALDVLNEDSAAWKEKAEADERRESGRLHEEVPGSWGNWDDELYG